jgi:hypothetical protein
MARAGSAPGSQLTYGLFTAFGVSSWVTINGIFAQLPLLVTTLPEGDTCIVTLQLYCHTAYSTATLSPANPHRGLALPTQHWWWYPALTPLRCGRLGPGLVSRPRSSGGERRSAHLLRTALALWPHHTRRHLCDHVLLRAQHGGSRTDVEGDRGERLARARFRKALNLTICGCPRHMALSTGDRRHGGECCADRLLAHLGARRLHLLRGLLAVRWLV